MAEKITNGAFTTNLSGWYNYGAYNFYPYDHMATAESGDDGTSHLCKLRQWFSVTGTAVTATVDAWIAWELTKKSPQYGSVAFNLYLRKPDYSLVLLATHSESASSSDNSGSMDLADGLDIVANVDQVGTYALELWASPKSAWYVPVDDPVYIHSYAHYDAISVLVSERQHKTVIEGLGGGEITKRVSGLAPAAEVAGLEETIAHHGGYQPGVDPKMEVTVRNKSGLHEFLHAVVEGNALEGAGMAESLSRTYSYRKRDLPGMPNVAGLDESLRARWKVGNVTIERDVLAPEDIWTDIVPADTTEWETI